MSYQVTLFNSLYDTDTTKQVEFKSWHGLAIFFNKLSKIYLPSKKSATMLSQAIYHTGTTRKNDNVSHWSRWIALDIDDHNYTHIEQIAQDYQKYNFICHSTASSTKDHIKFRLILSLTDAIPAAKITHFWYALKKQFNLPVDEQTKDLSRMFFVPAKYDKAYNFLFYNTEGIDLNSEHIMSLHEFTPISKFHSFLDRLSPEFQKNVIKYRQNHLTNQSNSATIVKWNDYSDCPFVNQDLIEEYKSISQIDNSGRYRMIYKIMVSIAVGAVRKQYPIQENELLELILQLDDATGGRYRRKKRALHIEAARSIAFAYKTAL